METPHRSAVHMGALLVLTRPFLREDQHTRVVQRLIEFVTETAGLSHGFGHHFCWAARRAFSATLKQSMRSISAGMCRVVCEHLLITSPKPSPGRHCFATDKMIQSWANTARMAFVGHRSIWKAKTCHKANFRVGQLKTDDPTRPFHRPLAHRISAAQSAHHARRRPVSPL